MSTADPFVSRLLSMLAPLGPVESRAMFGGYGLYLDGRFFAIVHGRRVYFRVDPETDVAADGGEPFRYRRNGKMITLAGYRAPPAGDTLLPWPSAASQRPGAAARKNRARPRSRRMR